MTICSKPPACSLLAMALLLALVGCSTSPRFATKTSPPPPRAESPKEQPASDQTAVEEPRSSRNPTGKILLTLEGVASYYADDYHGKQTSSGETYDMNDLTAAHRTFPFGTKVRVTNLVNNKTVVVRVTDRGPFKEGRIIDVSLAAAKELDLIAKGTAKVKLEVLEWGDGK